MLPVWKSPEATSFLCLDSALFGHKGCVWLMIIWLWGESRPYWSTELNSAGSRCWSRLWSSCSAGPSSLCSDLRGQNTHRKVLNQSSTDRCRGRLLWSLIYGPGRGILQYLTSGLILTEPLATHHSTPHSVGGQTTVDDFSGTPSTDTRAFSHDSLTYSPFKRYHLWDTDRRRLAWLSTQLMMWDR